MSDIIGFGGGAESRPDLRQVREFVPMRVGEATVFVEQIGELAEVEPNDEIYAAAPLGPDEAFEKASEILQECVRVVGERIDGLAQKAKPQEVTVEFALSLEATGKAQLIPVFLTGETKAASGLKVTAVWNLGAGGT